MAIKCAICKKTIRDDEPLFLVELSVRYRDPEDISPLSSIPRLLSDTVCEKCWPEDGMNDANWIRNLLEIKAGK